MKMDLTLNNLGCLMCHKTKPKFDLSDKTATFLSYSRFLLRYSCETPDEKATC